VRIVLQIANRG